MKFTLLRFGRGSLGLMLLWLLACRPALAQTPNWQAAVAAIGDVQVQASTNDGNGNVYLTGGFTGTATFGTTTLSTTNGQEIFVAKWNPTAGFVWALKGTSSATTGRSIATAVAISSPYVYIAGNFESQTLTLGSRPALTNAQAGTSDIFLARLTETGGSAGASWAKRAGGPANDYANALTNVGNSYLYLGGSSGGNATFENYTLAGAGGFVARYNAFNGTTSSTSLAPAVLAGDAVTALQFAGNSLYAAGTFNNAANTVPGGNLTSAGGEDLFILKLNANDLSSYWAQRAGGSGDDNARCLLASGSSVYVGGSYRSTTAAFGGTTLTNAGVANLFVSKLTDAGSSASFAWALQSTGTSTTPSNSAAALSLYGTSLYVAGTFGGTAGFGGSTLTSAGGSDVLVAKLSDQGSSASFVGAQQAGGSGADYAIGLGRLDTRTWYATGQVTAPASFGSISLGASAGVRPGFIATLSDPAPLLTLIAPNAGPVGTTVALYGEGLAGTTAITFAGTSNNIVTSGFTVNAAGTQISGVVVPAGAQSGAVNVTNPVGTSNGLISFTVGANAAPAWQGFAATTGPSLIRWAAPAANGTVVVAGEFNGSITLGSTTLTSAGSRDLFVAKFNPTTGSYVWAVQAGSVGDEDIYGGLAVSGNNIYLAGQFYGQSVTLGGTTLTATVQGAYSGYVAKLTDAGSSAGFTWAQLIDDGSSVFVESLAASGNNVYVGGDFTGNSLAIGSGTIATNVSGDDGYVAKFVDNGSTVSFGWARSIGEADGSTINVYGLSANGPVVYVSGVFYGTLNFNGSAPAITSVGSSNGSGPGDVAVIRLYDSGPGSGLTSAVRAGGAGNEFVYTISRQGSTLYVSGGTGSPTWTGATTTGAGGGFVAKVTDVGGALSVGWVQLLNRVVVQTAPNGTGVYAATALAGTDTFGGTLISSAGGSDGLVVRLTDAGSSAGVTWARAAGGLFNDSFRALALVNGKVVVGGSVVPLAAFGTNVVTGPVGVSVAALGIIADPAIVVLAATPAQPREPLVLDLYPNPAHNQAIVRLPAATTDPLQLFDAMGREVRRFASPTSTTEKVLDLRGLPAGLYVVRAGNTSRQLVVE